MKNNDDISTGFVTSLTKLWIQSNKLVGLPRTIGLVLTLEFNSV